MGPNVPVADRWPSSWHERLERPLGESVGANKSGRIAAK